MDKEIPQIKFFAEIDGESRGPFTLEQLEEQGVGPDTYVWCKGMQKWRKARSVADICRYWRLRLSESPAEIQPMEESPKPANENTDEPDIRSIRQIRAFNPADIDPDTDLNTPPRSFIVEAVLITLLCFPITGFIAIYHAIRSRRIWQSISPSTPEKEAHQLRLESHFAARSAKMWIGITFFLGLIVQGFLMRRML